MRRGVAGPELLLAAYHQALNERLWQTRSAHSTLNLGNIVWNAPELDNLMLQISNRKTGTRISVARLTD